jgi:hypothetical protein
MSSTTHAHEVPADRVVHVQGAGDRDLGADAVGRGGQQGPSVVLQRGDVDEAGEGADPAEHLRAVGRCDGLLHELDGAVAGGGVDAGGGVGDPGALGSGARGGVHASFPTTAGSSWRAWWMPCARATGSGRETGYFPEKQAVHSLSSGCAVAAIIPLLGDEAQRVRAERAGDLLDAQTVGDQLGARGEVDAVEAGPANGRGGDPHVDLGGSGLAQHPHDGALGVAAHDRVVDDHQALAGDHLAQGVELEADAELADGLAGLDEGAAHVGVLHHPLPVGDPGLLGVADRGRRPGLRGGDHQVRLDGMLTGELAAHLGAGLVHAAPCDAGVGAGEVDVLEDAALGAGLDHLLAVQALLVHDHHLAGGDLAHEARAADVQRRGLRGDDPAALEPAEHQGADALRVAGRVQRGLVHEREAVGAAQQRHHLAEGVGEAPLGVQQRGHQGGVGGVAAGELAGSRGALALVDQLQQLLGVDEVAVVGEGDGALVTGAEGGLGVGPHRAAGGGVAGVPDRDVPLEGLEGGLVEDLGDQAHVLVDQDLGAVGGRDARGFLSAMLEGVEPVVGEFGDVLTGGEDTEDAAGVLGALLAGEQVMGESSVATCHPAMMPQRGASPTGRSAQRAGRPRRRRRALGGASAAAMPCRANSPLSGVRVPPRDGVGRR